MATGKVVKGRVVLEGDPLPEGASVTVIVGDGEQAFELSPEEEEQLLESIAEADAGLARPIEKALRDL
jgi:hypothetical protein